MYKPIAFQCNGQTFDQNMKMIPRVANFSPNFPDFVNTTVTSARDVSKTRRCSCTDKTNTKTTKKKNFHVPLEYKSTAITNKTF